MLLAPGRTVEDMLAKIGRKVYGPERALTMYSEDSDGRWRLFPGDPVNTLVDGDEVLVVEASTASERQSEEGAGAASSAAVVAGPAYTYPHLSTRIYRYLRVSTRRRWWRSRLWAQERQSE